MSRLVAAVTTLALVLACSSGFGTDLLDFVATDPLLDGAAPLQPAALADLALERGRLGGGWLVAASRPDGAFAYEYDPAKDAYNLTEYNEVRHAGVTYALFQLYGATRDPTVLQAAEAAAGYIEANSHPLPDGLGKAFAYRGETKLGGQALAIVALIERRRALKNTSYDGLIRELASTLLLMERLDVDGAFYNVYDVARGEFRPGPESNFYPGEALLALARLAADFGDFEYQGAAFAVADYLIHRRDGDIPALGRIPREDHWLVLALSQLYEVRRDPDYLTVVWMHADSMVANQWTAAQDARKAGASRLSNPVNFNGAATKGEALVAAWGLALGAGDTAREAKYADAAMRTAQFSMRVQYGDYNSGSFTRPDACLGGWAFGPREHSVRMDNVQHNLSLLMGVWTLTRGAVLR